MKLEISNLTLKYGNHTVVDNLSHSFNEGKIHCILGPNGCGKTTLLRHLIRQYSDTGLLSYVPQETTGTIGLTVYDVISLGRYSKSKFFAGLSKNDICLIDDAMDKLQIKPLSQRIYDTLSGGEKQKVMLARALAQDTPWLILDEPSSNLDVKYSELIYRTLSDFRDRGGSVIIVMHDINAAAAIGDSFLLLKDSNTKYTADRLSVDLLSAVFGINFNSVRTKSDQEIFYIG